jgi:hypothetical protein
MAGYVRKTILSPGEVLKEANDALPDRLGLTAVKAAGHEATFAGKEGTVRLGAHRHSLYTEVVAETDQLRTSRMDYEIQRFLNRLPYEAGDLGGPGSGEFVAPRG